MSTYHVLLEKDGLACSAATCQVVPCTVIWINCLAFYHSFLALIAFLYHYGDDDHRPASGEPAVDEEVKRALRRPVLGCRTLGTGQAVIVAFILLIQVSAQPAEAQTVFTVAESSGPMMQLDGTPVDATGATAAGEQLYLEACAACHGQHGEGIANLGNTLVDSTFVQDSTDAEVLAFIRTGRDVTDPENQSGLAMPPSGGRPTCPTPNYTLHIFYGVKHLLEMEKFNR
ncbi:MAG: c-type cytochrome [Caldilineaceae bacterium]